MKKQIVEVTLCARGIKKKCRKVDRHSFKLGDYPEGYAVTDELLSKCRVILSNKMKSTVEAYLSLQPCEFTPSTPDNPFESRAFMMFTDTKVKVEV